MLLHKRKKQRNKHYDLNLINNRTEPVDSSDDDHLKIQRRQKQTKINDHFEHDPNIYDEDDHQETFSLKPNYGLNSNRKRHSRESSSEEQSSEEQNNDCDDIFSEYNPNEDVDVSKSIVEDLEMDQSLNLEPKQHLPVGKLIVTEDSSLETTGAEEKIISGMKALPKSIRKKFIQDKQRRQINDFKKPNASAINIHSDLQDSYEGRCKICAIALSGNLARNYDSVLNEKRDKKTNSFPRPMNGVCEAGITFLSTFRMKYDEMYPWINKLEACNALARVWNNKIMLERSKYIQQKEKHKENNNIDDFFKTLNDTIDKIDFKQENTKKGKALINQNQKKKAIYEDDSENELDSEEEEEEEEDNFLLDSLITVDDVLYHFDSCNPTDQINILRDTSQDLRALQRDFFKNRIYIKKQPVTIDGEEPNGKPKRAVDYGAFYGYLASIKISREIASELRATIRDERSGFLFNNLGLLKNHVPNLDAAKTITALKFQTAGKKSKASADQYNNGFTQGI